jgi:lysophospholipase L1-like esterase
VGDGFRYAEALPEGNYRVTVTLGHPDLASRTTIRSENRRLMAENIVTRAGQTAVCEFLVNIRTPRLSPGNTMKLNSREWSDAADAALTPTWDDSLTLTFAGENIAIRSIDVAPAGDDVLQVFLIGDSTVTDGGGSWGSTLPRWLTMPVVVANHAESGQTMKMFRFSRRWDKMILQVRPGDYVFMQFGHNDSKASGHDAMWPEQDEAGEWAVTHSDAATDYVWMLATNAVEIRRRGGIPVIVSPMTRIDRQTGRENNRSLGDYPAACRRAAELAGCAFIDLNTMSVELMNALPPDAVRACYTDATHSTPYGGYLFSRCIVEGIRRAVPDLARYLTDDAGTFDPARPEPQLADFDLPPDPTTRRRAN